MGQRLPCLKLGGNVGWVESCWNVEDLLVSECSVHCMGSISDEGACTFVPVEDPVQTNLGIT